MPFDQAIADQICSRIAEGEPLKPICREDGMPCFATVYKWIRTTPEFAAAMEEARRIGADAIADEVLEIVDDASNDWMERRDDKGGEAYVLNGEHVQRSKLRAEYRLKLLAKWHPKKYGEKLALAGDSENPLTVTVQRLTAKAPE
jgi:hypothetical protein